jgi:hypothetical protein
VHLNSSGRSLMSRNSGAASINPTDLRRSWPNL